MPIPKLPHFMDKGHHVSGRIKGEAINNYKKRYDKINWGESSGKIIHNELGYTKIVMSNLNKIYSKHLKAVDNSMDGFADIMSDIMNDLLKKIDGYDKTIST